MTRKTRDMLIGRLDVIPGEFEVTSPISTGPCAMWSDPRLRCGDLARWIISHLGSNHDLIHKGRHSAKTRRVHQAAFGWREAPCVGKRMFYCRPVQNQDAVHRVGVGPRALFCFV